MAKAEGMSNAVLNGLAGASGGIIAQIITYPLQTVNTRQQTERIAKKARVLIPPDRSRATTAGGTIVQILQVIRSEGLGGLYSGLRPSLFGTAASMDLVSKRTIGSGHEVDGLYLLDAPLSPQGIYYYFYQVFKNKAEAIAVARRKKGRGDGTVGIFSWLLVAAIAGSVNVLLTNPIWVLVTRMQTHTQAERKIMEAKREALLREASENSLMESTLQDKLDELDSTKPHPYGTLHAAREVYKEAGITGFWKGIIPTLIMVCNPSIQFMIYETSLKHLRVKRATIKQGMKDVTATEVFLLGALAKLGATVSTYPLLVVKSRLQAKQEIGGNTSLRYSGLELEEEDWQC
ncbi:peroxisomal nicotinamide adenine dinucleotide carrier-like isoform X3 [Cornus florida]|uniref:peroxisomal nicotinamide adenine dinucleotide carrier-like isoform X3 n=1 Tax=Cornus florida TaxID=4283 RepID=UPI00289CA081|nr:peroxisomal nicotinamide adenine dinucleotide carrier-like isoform X3 [Cornus florida]